MFAFGPPAFIKAAITLTPSPENKLRISRGKIVTRYTDLKKDTEHDPEGAEEFVALIRALRQSDSRSVTF